MNAISKMIEVLEHTPKSNQIVDLIELAESESSVDISKQIDLLTAGIIPLKEKIKKNIQKRIFNVV